jgi:anti-sigma regulatory factor (Ser/Thr protein kinase)
VAHRLVVDATPPCLDHVHGLLETVWADAPAVDASVRTRFALATAELVANVVEHGGAALPQPPRLVLEVDVQPSSGGVRGRIVDDGAAPPADAASGPPGGDPDPFAEPAIDLDELDLDALAESGRGLAAVRTAVDELRHERSSGRNVWVYVVRPR